MTASAQRTNPKLWAHVKENVLRAGKGGAAGQWSARKAQLAVTEYKKRGGGYHGEKSSDNHLVQWTQEDWGTKSGRTSGQTHERYLPKKARDSLSDSEYRRTTAKKRRDAARDKQFSRQPDDIAKKVALTRAPYGRHPAEGQSRSELLNKARARNIPGRSRMTKQQLATVLNT